VEDEPALQSLLRKYFEADRYVVACSADGHDALAVADRFAPDVVVLDLGLPGLDGIEVCRELRRRSDCYVVMLTARSDEVDVLVGLGVGADDYLTKPFSPRELLARVGVLLRRPRRPTTVEGPVADVVRVGELRIDPAVREVDVAGAQVDLTPREFDLLHALATRPRMVLTRRQLVDTVWGPTWVGDDRMVDVHIRNLRRKLGDDAQSPRWIRTVRGTGYRIGTGA
jgi:DNA-binding response OmpR family regulator